MALTRMQAYSTAVLAAFFLVAVPDARASQVMTYRDCLAMVDDNPVSAYGAALQWQKDGGGASAKHCMALALTGQGEHAQAAQKLEEVAMDIAVQADAFRRVPQLLSQAANAWLLADNGPEAERVLGDALDRRGLRQGMRIDLLIDRSRAHAMQEDYDAALEDLNTAYGFTGPAADVLIYRASAHRLLGNVEQAQEDIEQALRLVPDDVDALYERAVLKAQLGDLQDAREDWARIIQLDPHSGAAAAAQQNLVNLEAAIAEASVEPAATPPAPAFQSPDPEADRE